METGALAVLTWLADGEHSAESGSCSLPQLWPNSCAVTRSASRVMTLKKLIATNLKKELLKFEYFNRDLLIKRKVLVWTQKCNAS